LIDARPSFAAAAARTPATIHKSDVMEFNARERNYYGYPYGYSYGPSPYGYYYYRPY